MKKRSKRNWKPLALLITAVLMLSILPRAVAPTLATNDTISIEQNVFVDLDVNAWYYDGVMFVVERGLMTGVANGIFNPGGPLTLSMVNLDNLYPDMTAYQIYEGMSEWVAENIEGANSVSDIFGQNEYITKEQLANFGYLIQRGSSRMINPVDANYEYRKWTNITEQIRPVVNALTIQGMFRDFQSNEYNSDALAVRAEVACMLYRYLMEIERQNAMSGNRPRQAPTPPAPPPQSQSQSQSRSPFNDVDENAWYYDAVMFVVERGLMYRTGYYEFSPDMPLNSLMVNLNNLFPDVTEVEIIQGIIEWVSDYNAMGDPNIDMLTPFDTMTNEQLAQAGYLIQRGSRREIEPVLTDFDYSDWDQVTNYVKNVVDLLTRQRIYQDFPGNAFRPNELATRAEAASILYRYVTQYEIENGGGGRQNAVPGSTSMTDYTPPTLPFPERSDMQDAGPGSMDLSDYLEIFQEISDVENTESGSIDLTDDTQIFPEISDEENTGSGGMDLTDTQILPETSDVENTGSDNIDLTDYYGIFQDINSGQYDWRQDPRMLPYLTGN